MRRAFRGLGMSYRGHDPRFERVAARPPSRAVTRPLAGSSTRQVERVSRDTPINLARWAVVGGLVLAGLLVLALGVSRWRDPASAATSVEDPSAAAARLAARPAGQLLAARGPAPRLSAGSAGSLPVIPARAYVLVDEASGAILAESNSAQRLPPASVTKIATAILLLELGHLNDTVTIDADFSSLDPDSTTMGLRAGDRYSLRDLLYGLMLRSGNDAAVAIARAVSGDETRFVNTMNALVARLELPDTHFTDPHGLGGAQHYTSARDLASLARYGFTLPGFAEVVRTTNWDTSGTQRIELWNSNVFLYNYNGADGVKIGYTEAADRTLVASATRDGHRLIAVVLGDSYASTHAKSLLDWGWGSACWPNAAGGCDRVKPVD